MDNLLRIQMENEEKRLIRTIEDYCYLLRKCIKNNSSEEEQEDIYEIAYKKLEFFVKQANYIAEKEQKKGNEFHKRAYISRVFTEFSRNFKTYEDAILYIMREDVQMNSKYYDMISKRLFDKSLNYLNEQNIEITDETIPDIISIVSELIYDRTYDMVEIHYLTVDESLSIRLNKTFGIKKESKKR